jgi:hypothetical protein
LCVGFRACVWAESRLRRDATTAGTTKIYAWKLPSLNDANGPGLAVSPGLLSSVGATLLADENTYFVADVPAASAAALQQSLAPFVKMSEIRDDFDVLDFLTQPIDARFPEPGGPVRPPFRHRLAISSFCNSRRPHARSGSMR